MPYGTRLPAQSLGESFDLPEDRYLRVPTTPQAPIQQNQPQQVGPPPELAEVEGLTDAYYNNYARLNSFVKGLNKDYGIDVTAPDFSQPGGGQAFKTYQTMAANLMHTANKLGNRLKQQQRMEPLVAQGLTRETSEGQYTGTRNSPELEYAAAIAQKTLHTTGDVGRAQEQINLVTKELKERAEKTGDPYWKQEYEKALHLQAAYTTPPASFYGSEDKEKRKSLAKATREVGVLKEVIPLLQGHWKPGSFITAEDTQNPGKTIAINRAKENEDLGSIFVQTKNGEKKVDRKIDALIRNEDATIEMRFKPDAEGNVAPSIRTDNLNGLEATAMFQNQKPSTYGTIANTAAAADLLGIKDIGGVGINNEALFGDDYPALQEMSKGVEQQIQGKKKVVAGRIAVKDQLEKELGGGWTADKKTFKLPDGTELKIQKKFFGDDYQIVDEGGKKTVISKENLLQLLEDKGYFGQVETQPVQAAAPTISTDEEKAALPSGTIYIDSRTGQKHRRK